MLELINPSEIKLIGYEDKLSELKSNYSYTNKSILYEIERLKKNPWFVNKFGEEAWKDKLQELRSKLNTCLIKEKNDGFYTYSGFLQDLIAKYGDEFKSHYSLPKTVGLPWHSELPFRPRNDQLEALNALLEAHHGCVAYSMGSGKSVIILLLLKELGLKSVLMVPSVAIGNQLFNLFTKHLGRKYVGMFGNNKKEINKLITIALGQSLYKIKPNSPEYNHFSTCQVLASDEAHVNGADTFSSVCLNLLKNVPYRFFFTATPFRNDNSDLLLNGIMGKTVVEKSFKDCVHAGIISKPTFLIKKIQSKSSYYSTEPLRMIENHWYNNKELHKEAALLANKLVSELNHQVMIMIDHVKQFPLLIPYLLQIYDFAHGPLSRSNQKYVSEQFRNNKIDKIIEDFNSGKTRILIGTGAIGVGVDTKPVNTVINLQSGHSEVKFTQLVGRGNRTTSNKNEYKFVDFMIDNVESIKKHTIKRIAMYRDLYDNIGYL